MNISGKHFKLFLLFKKCIVFFGLLMASLNGTGQCPDSAEQEECKFAFYTSDSMRVVLTVAVKNSEPVFRLYRNQELLLQHPEEPDSGAREFYYSYYFRGGGVDNAGLDLNYLYFTLMDTLYVLYDTYSAEEASHQAGLKLYNLKNELLKIFPARMNSLQGSLTEFRFEEKVRSGERMFD